jgi:hypothetical protein
VELCVSFLILKSYTEEIRRTHRGTQRKDMEAVKGLEGVNGKGRRAEEERGRKGERGKGRQVSCPEIGLHKN